MSIDIILRASFPDKEYGEKLEEIIHNLKEKLRNLEELREDIAPKIYCERNITSHWIKMAEEAEIYPYLCDPETLGLTRAQEIIKPLKRGLALMKANPKRFKKCNSEDSAGPYYNGIIAWLSEYIEACEEHPDALVEVLR